jgi:hypothetical protein
VSAFGVYLLSIEKPSDLAQLLEAVEDEVQTQFFSPTVASNGALIINSGAFGQLIIPGKSDRRVLV